MLFRISALSLVAVLSCACTPHTRARQHFDQLDPGSSAKKFWSVAEAKEKISGQTFLRNRPGRSNEAIYFDTENLAYRWRSGDTAIARSTWVVSSRAIIPGTPEQTFVCVNFPAYTAAGEVIPGSATNDCIDPSLLFIPATEHARGDVFELSRRSSAPIALTAERIHIPELKAQVAASKQTD